MKSEKIYDIAEKIETYKQLSIDIMSHYGYTCGKVEVDANALRGQAHISIILVTKSEWDGVEHLKTKKIHVT